MNKVLNLNKFFVKEHIGLFKAANNYDIYNPDNGQLVLICREEKLSFLTKLLRFTDYKRMTAFNIEVKTPEGQKVLTISRKFTILMSRVYVYDENDILVGMFKQKLFSIGGKFEVLNSEGVSQCLLVGKWTSWEFKFIKDNIEFAYVTKKWSGIGKELFTSADNYLLVIDEKVPADNPIRMLIFAAVMCIDMVLKE
jgi:uncharacterized protein YxjI